MVSRYVANYPFDLGEPDPLKLIEQARLDPAERDLVVGGNAMRLFHIDD